MLYKYGIYLPTKLEEEKKRFADNLGNVKIDYRQGTGSAPYLFGTPYKEIPVEKVGEELAVLPNIVETATHITGSSQNYRTFSTDIGLVANDYQRNTLVLTTNGVIFEVRYERSVFLTSEDGPNTIDHIYSVLSTSSSVEGKSFHKLEPFDVSFSLEETGMINTFQSVVARREPLVGIVGRGYYRDFDADLEADPPIYPTIAFEEETTEVFGEDESVVPLANVKPIFKNTTLFEGQTSTQSAYKTTILPVTRFNRDGEVFSAVGSTILSDSFPNYYLQNVSSNKLSNDVVGYTTNISPRRGSLSHLVFSTDLSDLSRETDDNVGTTDLFLKSVYTGLLGSFFTKLEFSFPTVIPEGGEPIVFTFSNGANLVVRYTEDYDKFAEELMLGLNERGFYAIALKNHSFALIKGIPTPTEIEITIITELTEVFTDPIFSELQYLNSDSVTPYNSAAHPFNNSFSFIEDTGENLIYKGVFKSYTSDTGAYYSPNLRVIVDTSKMTTTQTHTLRFNLAHLGLKTVAISIPANSTPEAVIDLLMTKLTPAFLGNKYFAKKYLGENYFDIVNKTVDAGYVKSYLPEGFSVDSSINKTLFKSQDTSMQCILGPYDNSIAELSCFATLNTEGKVISGSATPSTTLVIEDAVTAVSIRTLIVPSNGIYTVTLTSAITDNKQVNVYCRDSAGNKSEYVLLTGTKDTIAPAMPMNVAFGADGLSITGVAEPNAMITVTTLDNAALATTTVPTSGTFRITLSNAVVLNDSVKITLTDQAGNVSAGYVVQRLT